MLSWVCLFPVCRGVVAPVVLFVRAGAEGAVSLGAQPKMSWQTVLKVERGHSCCALFKQSEIKSCLYCAALPLPSESFDSVISDIPFGKKFKTTNDAQLLPDILQEIERYV